MSGKVYHDCSNAGNPYHECNDRCFEKINSGDVLKKEKKPFGFGKPAWRKQSPPPPISPLPSYYAKSMVDESDDSPSFSSSDDTFNANLLSRPPSPLHGNIPELPINWLPMSPSLSVYCNKDSFASNFDHREMTPEHPLRTHQHMPRTPESRPWTPDRRSSTTDNIISLATRPRTPEHRSNITNNEPMTPEHAHVALGPKPKTTEHRERSSRQRSKTPEPQGKYLKPRTPQTQPILKSPETPGTPEIRPNAEECRARLPDHRARNSRPGSRISQATKNHGNKTSSVYSEECTLLYPELFLPPQKKSSLKPTTVSEKISEIQSICGTEEGTQSMTSESYVSVGSYKVRASVSDTLQQILDKHGDIASGSKLESLPTRSYFLETLASVVLQLQSTPLKQLKETRVLEMLAVVEDVESVRIRAGWLREALNEILEAARCYDGHNTTVVEKGMCERDALLGRQEMEEILKEVRRKEDEVKSYRRGLTEMAGRLGDLEMKRARLERSLAFLSSKVDKFDGESVLEKLF
ncbi:uncharacterized protein LOC130498635 [Raphanus sativus]|uniref:Uncharacterized protein LOC108821737 n=1 Tax=Raphanus sativus TaxID=3726 RepID=A0A6J0KT27_RAPSA|nr:uncharacterized protein LOC108821737 [Raphanus sativus]XP_056848136.1 uncharacterized protein LOC130498635 [Raphanus sativus]